MVDTPIIPQSGKSDQFNAVYEIINNTLGIGPGHFAPSSRFAYLPIDEREILRDSMADVLFGLSTSQKEMFNEAIQNISEAEIKAQEAIKQPHGAEIIRDDFKVVTGIKPAGKQRIETHAGNLLMYVSKFSEMALMANDQLTPNILILHTDDDLKGIKALGQDLNDFYVGIDQIDVEKKAGPQLKSADLIILETVLNYTDTDREILNRKAFVKVKRLFEYYKSFERTLQRESGFLNNLRLQFAEAAVLKAFPKAPVLLYSPLP